MFLVLLNSNYAMSKRIKEDDSSSKTYAMNDKGAFVTETILDTLNRGRELTISEKDFSPLMAETTTTAQIPAGKVEVPNGFRVQVIASSQIDRIRAEQKTLEEKVNYPLYIIVTPPYYKLVAGDFIKRNDADAAVTKLKDLGYADAWVVRSKVWANH